MNMKASYKHKTQTFKKEQTIYWFDVEFQLGRTTLGVVESGCDEPFIVDLEFNSIDGTLLGSCAKGLESHVTDDMRLND